MRKLLIVVVILLAGCADNGVSPQHEGDTGVTPQQCQAIQRSCAIGGIYDELVREDGELMCTCHRMYHNPEPQYNKPLLRR